MAPLAKRIAPTLVALSLAMPPAVAHAQQATAITERQDFSVERFRMSLDADGLLALEGSRTPEHLALSLGLWLGYAKNPLVVYRRQDDARVGGLVEGRFGGSLVAALGLFGFAEVGLEVPLVLAQSRPSTIPGIAGSLPTLSGFGLGGPRVVPKLQLLRQGDHAIDLALATSFVLPSPGDGGYFAQDGFVFEPSVALGRTFGALRIGAELGGRVRQPKSIADLVVDHELFGALGLGYAIDAGGRTLELQASLAAATSAPDPFDRPSYVELLGGATYELAGPVLTFLAVGAGLDRGVGSPDWRGLAGLRLTFERDAPASTPAPVVAFDPDRDDDGQLDWDDRCIDVKGPIENHGCPDADRDGDTIADRLDRCPDEPEDRDGFEDGDGCRDLDDDGDTIADANDRCPRVIGVRENGGCPDVDRDGDRIADRHDNCPDQTGDWTNRGCAKKQLVVISSTKLDILDKVYFDTGKATIQPRSFALLDDVARVITSHPELARIEVEGHTDDQGNDASNLKLSDRRASAVKDYLVKKGVAAERLGAKGWGETRPIATNRTPDGRAENRRVEFRIVGGSTTVQ